MVNDKLIFGIHVGRVEIMTNRSLESCPKQVVSQNHLAVARLSSMARYSFYFSRLCVKFLDFFFFLWSYPLHMEVPRPGIESEL